MPDIVLYGSDDFPSGEPVPAQKLDALWGHPTENTSHSVINGELDAANKKTGISIDSEKIRPRTCTFGKMEGLTGNFDFHGDKVFSEKYTNKEAFVPLPGAGISFYIPPNPPRHIIITWTVFGANATMFEKQEDDEKLTRMRFFINGESTEGTRVIPSSRHGHNGWDPIEETHSSAKPWRAWRRPHRDRVWSGHYAAGFDPVTWPDTLVKVGWNHAWIGVHNEDQTARFRVRNMKAIWFY